MRTTVSIPDDLLERAKARSASENRTLGDIMADGLRVVLYPSLAATKPGAKAPPLPTFRGQGLQPGVDLDNNAALLDLMETP
jgi:hypothetical protein